MTTVTELSAALSNDDIRRAYRNYLWREPDPAGVEVLVGKNVTYKALTMTLSASDEHLGQVAPIMKYIRGVKSPKVLLFGAYGNGNLGDDIQADALAEIVKIAIPNASIFSTSCFVNDYPFVGGIKLRNGAIYSNHLLAEFDLLIIGGGGLLAHPHAPLSDRLWIDDLNVPMFFFGVGVHGTFVAEAAASLKKAILVGCRDASSLNWASPHTHRIALTLDPVLLSGNIVPPAPIKTAAKRYNRCWIIRDPIDEDVMAVRQAVSENDIVIGLEPRVDCILSNLFPEIVYISTLEQAWEVLCASHTVISMRYHGVILAIKAGVSAYALRIPKASRLLELIGHTEYILLNANNTETETAPIVIEAQLDFWRDAGVAHIASQFHALKKDMNVEKNDLTRHIDRDQVVACYRAMLGREPESEAVIQSHVDSGATLQAFLSTTLQSHEFLSKNRLPQRRRSPSLSASVEIEVSGTSKQMRTLMSHMRDVWTKYGNEDPYYSVLTNEGYRNAVISESKIIEFFEQGEGEYRFINRTLANNGIDTEPNATILDMGCGLGRVGSHFAKLVANYIGVDISRPHIDLAKKYFERAGIKNAEFMMLDKFLKTEKVADLIFSVIVLQHNPPPVIGLIIDRMCRALRPGGTLLFQVPTALTGYRFCLSHYLANLPNQGVMEMHAFPQKEVFKIFRQNGLQPVEVFEHDMIGPIGESTVFVAVKDR